MKKLLCILLVCLFGCASALAGADSSICWTLFSDIDTDARRAFTRILDPDTGKSKDYDHPGGYIIQKDVHEFPGVLYARMDTEALRIVHRAPDGKEETIYEGSSLAVYWANGDQTVRAFMDGCLYYVKVQSYEGTSTDHYSREIHPNPADGQFCRIDANGNEYAYQRIVPAGHAFDIISGYALHPNGTLAWVETENDPRYPDLNYNDIHIESPEGGHRIIVDPSRFPPDYYYIPESLCWLDEHTLLFTMYRYHASESYLFTVDTKTEEIQPLLSKSGKELSMDKKLGVGIMTLDASGRYLAHFAEDAGDTDADRGYKFRSIPSILDLHTGKERRAASYNNPKIGTLHETRYKYGQLSWIEN